MTLESLENVLKGHASATGKRSFGKPHLMREVLTKIQKRTEQKSTLGESKKLKAYEIAKRDGIEAAARIYIRQLCQILAWSPEGKDPLFQMPQSADHLLQCIRDRSSPLSSSGYHGLLSQYLTTSKINLENEHYEASWHIVREFLSVELPKLFERKKRPPPWLVTIMDNKNLLSENDPCGPYVEADLEGLETAISALREKLKLQKSWVFEELYDRQIKFICEQNDEEFEGSLEKAIEFLSALPALTHKGLAELLKRYFEVVDKSVNKKLKEFAIETWGSPSLPSKAEASWNLVPQPVKGMVQEWVAREDLQEFFTVIKDDEEVDSRRLDYWLRFIKQIHFTKIYLGDDYFRSEDQDIKKIREKRGDDRMGRLIGNFYDGENKNNAILLRIGSYLLVEFSQKGNAAYGYSEGSQQFNIEDKSKSAQQLKDKRKASFRGPHQGGWEKTFDEKLSRLGVFPDDDASSYSLGQPSYMKQPAPRSAQVSNLETNGNQQSFARKDFESGELPFIAKKFDLIIENKRDKGGHSG